MNRIIKFRVWDKELKRFYYPINPESGKVIDNVTHEEAYRHIRMGTLPLILGMTLMGCVYESVYGECSLAKNLDVQQFTSLKDKNNKEIYEGDILESLYPSEGNDKFFERGIVKYYDDLARFGLEFYSPSGGEGYTGKDQNISDFIKDGWFVIGNIFENPELLEETKV